ncbi:UvrD-helicase domain-containing protein [Candidatus Saccharibacteria bacterium]|nr:UvrD-helicase domain-containing protein [Candidatus Saccharibacteria bacterium]
MKRKKSTTNDRVEEVRRWFSRCVTYEGEAYVIDSEQAAAVIADDLNAIVVARAGSGKTRTIVAKIVYLIACKGVKPEEIMAFVFNANAAREINERLSKMMVDGKPVVEKAKIASTFHAFSRKIVYEACGGRKKCGKILAGEKEEFMLAVVEKMMREPEWRDKVRLFIRGTVDDEDIEEAELMRFAGMMTLFVNRAQQRYLGGEKTLAQSVEEYLAGNEVEDRERNFVELGVECYRRYHWYLLDAKRKLKGFEDYGTDFNLIVSWASKLIWAGRGKVPEILRNKKYILIDEYQDFSQLFLAAVEAIRSVARDSRLFVVGDDWQAINRFAGSDVEYFKNFEEYFTGARRYEITTNYRCNYTIVDTARKFMKKAMKGKGGFRAFSKRAGRVVIVEVKRLKAEYLKYLVKILRENRKANDILILHRNNETNLKISLEGLKEALKRETVKARVMTEEEFDAKVRVMTMHKSKGLEAEAVVILEADAGVIPKTHPDTRLFTVFCETEKVTLDDQKRLFYVAMTRAKKRLYIMHEKVPKRKLNGFIPYLGWSVERWEE